MAKFCSTECKSVCDFCKHYRDEYRDIKKLMNKDGTMEFAGEGLCGVDGSKVYASDGYECDNFECFLIKF